MATPYKTIRVFLYVLTVLTISACLCGVVSFCAVLMFGGLQ